RNGIQGKDPVGEHRDRVGAALVAAIDQAEELLGAGVVESLEDLQAARIEVLPRLALCFEVGDRACEVRIGRVGGVPTAAVFAELLGPAVLDRLSDRVSYLAAEML